MGSLYAAGIVVQPRRKEREGEKAHRSLFIDRRRSKLRRERAKERKYLPDIRPFMFLFCILTLVSDAVIAAACVGSSK
jgi:hypothetical protein